MRLLSKCAKCGGRSFRVINIDEDEATQRVCLSCGATAFIGDSDEHWSGADHDSCECPCEGEEFSVAVGFAFLDDGEVRWVSVGLRC
jgi:predicted nucleic-acid-binding Zn-ribbon protein